MLTPFLVYESTHKISTHFERLNYASSVYLHSNKAHFYNTINKGNMIMYVLCNKRRYCIAIVLSKKLWERCVFVLCVVFFCSCVLPFWKYLFKLMTHNHDKNMKKNACVNLAIFNRESFILCHKIMHYQSYGWVYLAKYL